MSTNAIGDVVPMRRLKFKRSKSMETKASTRYSAGSAKASLESDKENLSASFDGKVAKQGPLRSSSTVSLARKKRAPLSVLSRSDSKETASFHTAKSEAACSKENPVASLESRTTEPSALSPKRSVSSTAQSRARVEAAAPPPAEEYLSQSSEGEHSFDAFDDASTLDGSLLLSPYDSPAAQALISELEEEADFLRQSWDVKSVGTSPFAGDASASGGTGSVERAEAVEMGAMLLLCLSAGHSSRLGFRCKVAEVEKKEAEERTTRLEQELAQSEVVRRAQEETIRRLDETLAHAEESSRADISRQEGLVEGLWGELRALKKEARRGIEEARAEARAEATRAPSADAQTQSEPTASGAEIVVDTREWLDFSCQVNTIDNSFNPVFTGAAGGYFVQAGSPSGSCASPCSSESSSSEGETDPMVHIAADALRLRRQNAKLKETIDSLARTSKSTQEELLRRNAELLERVERQASENFELVCKHRQSLSKLSEVLEERERDQSRGGGNGEALKEANAVLRRELEIRENDLQDLRRELMGFVEKLQEQQHRLTQVAAEQQVALRDRLEAGYRKELEQRLSEQGKAQARREEEAAERARDQAEVALGARAEALRAEKEEAVAALQEALLSLEGLESGMEQVRREKEHSERELLGIIEELNQGRKESEEVSGEKTREALRRQEADLRSAFDADLAGALERQEAALKGEAAAREESALASLTEDLHQKTESALSSLRRELEGEARAALDVAMAAKAKEAEEALASLSRGHAAQLEEMVAAHSEEVASLREELDRSAEEGRARSAELEAAAEEAAQKADALEGMKESMENALAALEQQSEALEMTMAALKEEHEDQIASLREAHLEELQGLRDAQEPATEEAAEAGKGMEDLRRDLQSSFEKRLEAEREASVVDREAALTSLRREHEGQMSSLREGHAVELASLRQELAAAAEEERVKVVELERSKAEAKVSEARAALEREAAEKRSAALQADHESARERALEQQKAALETSADKNALVFQLASVKAAHGEEVGRLKEELGAVHKANLLMESQVAKAEVSIKRLQKAVSRLSTENAELCSNIVEIEHEQRREREREQGGQAKDLVEGVIKNLKDSLSLDRAKKASKKAASKKAAPAAAKTKKKKKLAKVDAGKGSWK